VRVAVCERHSFVVQRKRPDASRPEQSLFAACNRHYLQLWRLAARAPSLPVTLE